MATTGRTSSCTASARCDEKKLLRRRCRCACQSSSARGAGLHRPHNLRNAHGDRPATNRRDSSHCRQPDGPPPGPPPGSNGTFFGKCRRRRGHRRWGHRRRGSNVAGVTATGVTAAGSTAAGVTAAGANAGQQCHILREVPPPGSPPPGPPPPGSSVTDRSPTHEIRNGAPRAATAQDWRQRANNRCGTAPPAR
jgi:hypothetical protein